MMERHNQEWDEDKTSHLVDCREYDTEGLALNFPLRWHNSSAEGAEGLWQARHDWRKHIGPLDAYGGANPLEGSFGALTMPLCRPERLPILEYVFEYAFLYDEVLESAAKAAGLDVNADNLVLENPDPRIVKSVEGTKHIQKNMIGQLFSVDPELAPVVVQSWKTMVATTSSLDKEKGFSSLEEYVDYRIVDTGAPFVDTLMRYGMGILLSEDEIAQVAHIVKPCYAALGLANDYFSFNVEYAEFKGSKAPMMTNLVWLFMQWRGVGAADAKRLTREVAVGYEEQFRRLRHEFENSEPKPSAKLRMYLAGLAYQISGNVYWSLRCPRYHPEYRNGAMDENPKVLHTGAPSNNKKVPQIRPPTHRMPSQTPITAED